MVSALAVVFIAALDNDVYRCMNNTCVELEGQAEMKSITVDGNGRLWGLSPAGFVNYLENSKWKPFDESTPATFLAVRRDGTPYIVGKTSQLVYKWSGSRWDAVPDSKKTKALAFDRNDNMWVIDTGNNVWYTYPSKWIDAYSTAEGATAIAVSKNSDAYIINTAKKVLKATMKGWKELPDAFALDIAVDSYGTLWAIGLENRVWYLDENEVWQHYGEAIKGTEIAVF